MKVKRIQIGFGLILLLLMTSCSVKQLDSETDQVQGDIGLQVVDQLVLSLDSTTSTDSFMLEYLEYNGEPRLAYFNRGDQTIRLFDIDNGEQETKLTFDKAGPNRVLYIAGFTIHNKDSIFLTDGYQTNYLVNSSSQLISKYRTEDANLLKHAPGPWVRTGSPMIYDKGKLFYQGYVGGVFDQPNMVQLDLESNKIDYFNGYPLFYQEAYWRGGFEYMYFTYNQKSRIIVSSFVADHNIQTINLDSWSEINEYPASGSGFGKLRAPRQNMGDPGHEKDEKKFMLQPSYGRIHYDFNNDLYYRLAYDGISESDYDSNDPLRSSVKPARIIILDNQFNKLGEYDLGRFQYEPNMAFTGAKGLYLKRMDDENEDIVTFDVIGPESK